MCDRLVSDELAKNVPEADKLLELHQERKVRIINFNGMIIRNTV